MCLDKIQSSHILVPYSGMDSIFSTFVSQGPGLGSKRWVIGSKLMSIKGQANPRPKQTKMRIAFKMD